MGLVPRLLLNSRRAGDRSRGMAIAGPSVRLCVVSYGNLVYVNDNQIRGNFGSVYQFLPDMLSTLANVSLNLADKVGDRIKGSAEERLDGCLGKMQGNESDSHLVTIKLPVLARGLAPLFPVMTSNTIIGSVYDTSEMNQAGGGVMAAFAAFDVKVWLAILGVSFLLGLLLTLSSLLLRRRRRMTRSRARKAIKQSTAVLCCNSLKQSFSSFKIKSTSAALTYACLLVFFFLILFYLVSMIKTEKVVQHRPDTIDTYDDIVARNVTPTFMQQLADHEEFEEAKPGTPASQVWRKVLAIGVDVCRVKAHFDTFSQVVTETAERRRVLLGSSHLVPIFVHNACAYFSSNNLYPTKNTWVRDSGPENLRGFLVSSSSSPAVKRLLRRVLQAAIESGSYSHSVQALNHAIFHGANSERQRDCVSNRLIYPDIELLIPDPYHFQLLFLIMAAAFVLAFLVHLCTLAVAAV